MENEAGALSRVAGLFSSRGYNIESLTVAATEDPTLSRMTLVTSGSDDVIEQITKQLNKLIEIVKVVDLSDGDHIERELMLMKVRAVGKDREEIKRMADIFRGRIIDTDMFTPTTIVRYTGHENGAVYGSPEKHLDGRTHLENLFICGTDQGLVGIIGSITSGIAMAKRHCLRAT